MKKLVGIVLTSLALGGTAVGVGEIIDDKLDYENGKFVYEMEVDQGGNEYEYKVEAPTGTKLTAKKESTSDDIGKEKAKEIALQKAGISADQVVWEEVERDYDDGRLEYQIEFRVGNKEYGYEIDGKTGNVLEKDFDVDNDRYD